MEGKEFCSIIMIALLIGEIDSMAFNNIDFIKMMTRKQIKNAAKIVKGNCMKKINVTEDLIGDIEKGKFIEERPVMCYIACVYKTTQLVKNNKISYEASLKQVQINYPDDMKEGMLISIENCKGLLKKYKDLCESAYWTAKCIYEDNPKNFLFP